MPILTLYSAKRDQALGLPRPGQRTLNLLDYRRKRERQAMTQLGMIAFLKGVIDECQHEVKLMIEVADTPEKRRVILPQVQRLGDIAQAAATKLEKMTRDE